MSGYYRESNRDAKMICECREVDSRSDNHRHSDWHRHYCSNGKSRRQCGCQHSKCRCHRRRYRRYEVFVRELD